MCSACAICLCCRCTHCTWHVLVSQWAGLGFLSCYVHVYQFSHLVCCWIWTPVVWFWLMPGWRVDFCLHGWCAVRHRDLKTRLERQQFYLPVKLHIRDDSQKLHLTRFWTGDCHNMLSGEIEIDPPKLKLCNSPCRFVMSRLCVLLILSVCLLSCDVQMQGCFSCSTVFDLSFHQSRSSVTLCHLFTWNWFGVQKMPTSHISITANMYPVLDTSFGGWRRLCITQGENQTTIQKLPRHDRNVSHNAIWGDKISCTRHGLRTAIHALLICTAM